jgi:glycosyltransferase involved in cell wall biosynthesis
MRIAFYAPFKPLDHPNPSGDQMIGRGIRDFLLSRGHYVDTVSTLRARWIYRKPAAMIQALPERRRVHRMLRQKPVDLWLTYHCYYKAPDLLGPSICRTLKLPYAIIQPSYGTRVSRHWKTRPGFMLNRRALLAADALITDRAQDFINLQRLVAPERLHRIRPGLNPEEFTRDPAAGDTLRRQWQTDGRTVLLSAAMFRADVKAKSLHYLLDSCKRVQQQGHDFLLVIVGDGPEKNRLQQSARRFPGGMVRFVGRVARQEMYRYYSAADLFAFPGINESLGMVFLEAQSCGLPVVACDNGGIPEVVAHGKTGLLTDLDHPETFDQALIDLLQNRDKRRSMGRAAAEHIRTRHDSNRNYRQMEQILKATVDNHAQN